MNVLQCRHILKAVRQDHIRIFVLLDYPIDPEIGRVLVLANIRSRFAVLQRWKVDDRTQVSSSADQDADRRTRPLTSMTQPKAGMPSATTVNWFDSFEARFFSFISMVAIRDC